MLPWRQALSPIWSHRLRLAGAEVKVKHETGVHFGCNLCWYEWCTWTSWCLPGSRTWWRDVTYTWVQCITQKQQLIYTWLIGIISIFPNGIFFLKIMLWSLESRLDICCREEPDKNTQVMWRSLAEWLKLSAKRLELFLNRNHETTSLKWIASVTDLHKLL